jgi:predicted metal-dependent phosphoesterase TrpH
MCARLTAMGCVVSAESLLAAVADGSGRSIGRPAIADALVRAGHAKNRDDAFARLIGRDSPAFVPRSGVSVAGTIAIIAGAGGLASLAHPVLAAIDDRISALADSGLAALECRHPDHPPDVEARYRALAARLGLAVTGGSDFHGDDTANGAALGTVTLDAGDFSALGVRRRVR